MLSKDQTAVQAFSFEGRNRKTSQLHPDVIKKPRKRDQIQHT
jgi:hypothetical protein